MFSQALVAHTCNPSYSEAEIRRIAVRSQPGQIVRETLSQKTLHKKKAGGVPQEEGPEFKPQYCIHTHIHKYRCSVCTEQVQTFFSSFS
jgi:hypothetical protein